MSATAIYEVTRALRMLLHSQLTLVSANAVVTLLPPGDNLPEVSGVNLYLYRVTESPFTRNRPWPGDRATAASIHPPLGLQLHYLLTPLGVRPDDTSQNQGDDAHTMLGVAMRTLQQHPVVNLVHIAGFDADAVLPDFLLDSFEQIKVTLSPATIEDLSKIWASINRPYRLSVAYEVSLVQITPTSPPSAGAGIVLTTGVDVRTFGPPQLLALVPEAGAIGRLTSGGTLIGNTLRIDGVGLTLPGLTPAVRIAGRPAIVQATPPPTPASLTVALPDDVDAGPGVDVRVTLGGRTGAPLRFVVSPWLERIEPIRTALDPALPGDLVVTARGDGFTSAPQAVRFAGPGAATDVTAFQGGGTGTEARVSIPTTLPNGTYEVRVVLADGVRSVTNARLLEVMPRIATPIGVTVVASGGRQVHRLTIDGARLSGSDVRLILDGVPHAAGANADDARMVYTLARQLTPGAHDVAVAVDGHVSRTVAVGV